MTSCWLTALFLFVWFNELCSTFDLALQLNFTCLGQTKLQFSLSHQVVVRAKLRVSSPKRRSPFYIPCFPKYSFVKFWEMYITVKIFQHMGNEQAMSSGMLECFLMNEWVIITILVPKNNSTVGIITLVIIEMCMLWLVKDCVSCYNHLTQGDYSRSAKFQNGCLTFSSLPGKW